MQVATKHLTKIGGGINIGIIGTGFGGKIHLPGFQKIKGARVLAIAGRDLKKTKELAKKYKVPLAFKNWRELVRHPEIDAVSIATPPYLHAPMALEAIKRGKHVFCEKPLAMSVEEAQKMLRAARRARIRHAIDFEFRETPHFKFFKELLLQKRIGKLRYINISWLTGGRAGPNVPYGWQNNAKLGGGTLLAFASHMVDYLEWFFGPVQKILANLIIAKKYTGGKKVSADDTCDILMEFSDGTSANLAFSNVLPGNSGHKITAYGGEGKLELLNPNLDNFDMVYGFEIWETKLGEHSPKKLSLPSRFGRLPRYPDGRLALFAKTAQNFIASIKKGKNLGPSFREGLRAQIILEAAQKSNRLGRWITLPR